MLALQSPSGGLNRQTDALASGVQRGEIDKKKRRIALGLSFLVRAGGFGMARDEDGRLMRRPPLVKSYPFDARG